MRQLIYDRLASIAGLKSVHQGESITKAPEREEFPIAVYRLGNESPENLGSDDTSRRVYFQVYVHDKPADYTRIDGLIEDIKTALDLGDNSVGSVVEVTYLETSRDLDDAFFGSIMRYVRFQAVLAN